MEVEDRLCFVARRAVIALLLILFGSIQVAAAQQTFSPARKLTTWDTDRSMIDVEVVATTAGSPETRRFVIPRQSLQLRLERAYVDTLLWDTAPPYDYSSLALSLDVTTQRPLSVERSSLNIGGLARDAGRKVLVDLARRTLLVRVNGHRTSQQLGAASSELLKCRGAPEQFDLFAFKGDADPYCRLAALTIAKKMYVGMLAPDLVVQVICTTALVGCSVSFPFEFFAPTVVFHEDRLPKWKDMVRKADNFLEAKKFKQGEK